MKFEPTKEQLIDFVYGNLPESECLLLDQAMRTNPSLKEEVDALVESKSFLHHLEDEEVIEQDRFVWELSRKLQRHGSLWPIISVAASLTLLLLVAYATQFSISYGSFELAFGNSVPVEMPQELNSQQVQDMINNSISTNNVSLVAQFDDVKSDFEAQLVANNRLQLKDLKRIAANSKELPKAQVQEFLGQLSESNRSMVNDFFTASVVEQRDYMNSILTDYFEYIDNKRKDDYQAIQATINDLEYKNNMKTRETDQILSSILTTFGGNSM